MSSNADSIDTIAADDREAHFRHSVLRERIVEHLFIGEALRRLWTRDIFDAEILRFDAGGYDLVMCRGPIVRHVQLKVSLTDSSTSEVKASLRLLDKPSGCILWLLVTAELELQSFLWFGSEPGEPLSDITGMKTAQHTKGNADGVKLERESHRVIPRNRFETLGSIDEVLYCLFGALP
jgi:hypothetical protein